MLGLHILFWFLFACPIQVSPCIRDSVCCVCCGRAGTQGPWYEAMLGTAGAKTQVAMFVCVHGHGGREAKSEREREGREGPARERDAGDMERGGSGEITGYV